MGNNINSLSDANGVKQTRTIPCTCVSHRHVTRTHLSPTIPKGETLHIQQPRSHENTQHSRYLHSSVTLILSLHRPPEFHCVAAIMCHLAPWPLTWAAVPPPCSRALRQDTNDPWWPLPHCLLYHIDFTFSLIRTNRSHLFYSIIRHKNGVRDEQEFTAQSKIAENTASVFADCREIFDKTSAKTDKAVKKFVDVKLSWNVIPVYFSRCKGWSKRLVLFYHHQGARIGRGGQQVQHWRWEITRVTA